MEIRRAEHLGFCGGVRRAIDMAEAELELHHQLNALGPLVHNPRLIQNMGQRGLKTLASTNEVQIGETIMIRAHGSGPCTYKLLEQKKAMVLDATCPSVKRIFNLAKEHSEAGYTVLILGEKKHPEVEAIKEWSNGKGIIIESKEDLLDVPPEAEIVVLSQSTLAQEVFETFLFEIRRIFSTSVVFNTICSATKVRQEAAVRLAKEVDVMLVVGSRQSANSRHLFDLCFPVNPRTYLIEGTTDLRAEWFFEAFVVGITAGASVPDWIIKEVECNVLEKELKINEGEIAETPEVEKKTTTEIETITDEVVEPTADEVVEAIIDQVVETECDDVVEEAVETQEVPVTEHEEFDMESFHLPRYNPGDIIQATVVQVGNDEILVDVGQKSEGVIPRKEFSADSSVLPTDVLNVGDEITVMVIRNEDQEGRLTFSKKRAEQHQHWLKFTESLNQNEVIEGQVLELVKGGLIVDIGVRAFMPASLAERRFTSDLKHLVGEKVRVRLVEVDADKRRAIVNRKMVLEEEASASRDAFWQNTKEGDIVKGIVRRLTKFGAFVDLGGIDGLLHISDLDYYRVKDPSEVVSINEELELKVLKLDPEAGRISLGLKQLKMEPWEAFAQDYFNGDVVQGVVVRITPWGAFVNVRPGIDGLIHISELDHQRVEKVEDVVSVGQEVEAKILEIDLVRKRLSLSLRALLGDDSLEQHIVDQLIEDVQEQEDELEQEQELKLELEQKPVEDQESEEKHEPELVQ